MYKLYIAKYILQTHITHDISTMGHYLCQHKVELVVCWCLLDLFVLMKQVWPQLVIWVCISVWISVLWRVYPWYFKRAILILHLLKYASNVTELVDDKEAVLTIWNQNICLHKVGISFIDIIVIVYHWLMVGCCIDLYYIFSFAFQKLSKCNVTNLPIVSVWSEPRV